MTETGKLATKEYLHYAFAETLLLLYNWEFASYL